MNFTPYYHRITIILCLFFFKPTLQADSGMALKRVIKKAVTFESQRRFLAYPVSAEVYVNTILNRDDFRSLCDKHKGYTAILKAL